MSIGENSGHLFSSVRRSLTVGLLLVWFTNSLTTFVGFNMDLRLYHTYLLTVSCPLVFEPSKRQHPVINTSDSDCEHDLGIYDYFLGSKFSAMSGNLDCLTFFDFRYLRILGRISDPPREPNYLVVWLLPRESFIHSFRRILVPIHPIGKQ